MDLINTFIHLKEIKLKDLSDFNRTRLLLGRKYMKTTVFSLHVQT